MTEIALAIVALVGAGLFVRSMQNAQLVDPGFESRNLFVFAFDLGALHYDEDRGQQYFRAAIERAEASPGVASASIASNFPLGGGVARRCHAGFSDGSYLGLLRPGTRAAHVDPSVALRYEFRSLSSSASSYIRHGGQMRATNRSRTPASTGT